MGDEKEINLQNGIFLYATRGWHSHRVGDRNLADVAKLQVHLHSLGREMAFSWLRSRRSKKQDYEAQLAALRIEIDRRNTQLAQIRHRQRRASLALTLYAAGAWLIYVLLWHFRLLPRLSSSPVEMVLKTILPFLGPFLSVPYIRLISTATHGNSSAFFSLVQ
jgi:hypothetical protein